MKGLIIKVGTFFDISVLPECKLMLGRQGHA